MPLFSGSDWYGIAANRREIPITEGILTDLISKDNLKEKKTDNQFQNFRQTSDPNIIPFHSSFQDVPPHLPQRQVSGSQFPLSQAASYHVPLSQFVQDPIPSLQVTATQVPFQSFATTGDNKPRIQSKYFKNPENLKPLSYFKRQKVSHETSSQTLIQYSSAESLKLNVNTSELNEIQNGKRNLYLMTPNSSDSTFDLNKFRAQKMNKVWTSKLEAEE